MSREDEIRERTEKYDRVYRLTGGQESPWHVEDARYLLNRVAELEADRARVVTDLRRLAADSDGGWALDPPDGYYERYEARREAFRDAADLVERGGR